jgi:serine/threonine protein kinase
MKYGRYKIMHRLGKGSMGEVYLAHDPDIDRKVALKVLYKDHLASKEIVNRFFKEAKAIGRLSHPDIVSIYDVGQDHGTIYIAMEYLEGKPLHEAVRSIKLDVPAIVNIGKQVAAALDYAHKKGIVHRDIKPSNLILTDDYRIKLTDFGIAHLDDASLTLQTRSGDILGTPAYMSPEQIAGEEADSRSDLYSLGVILYELTVGQRPFVENNITALFTAITQNNPVPPKKANPSIAPGLSALILKAMDKDPDRRYQSGAKMASALADYLSSQKTDAQLPAGPSKYMRLVWVATLIAATLICWQIYDHMVTNQPEKTAIQADKSVRQPITVWVDISSEPSNANIYLNNTFKGKTPMRCQLPLGQYDLRLTLVDHYESEAQINVDASGELPVHLRLIPIN